LEIIDPLCVLFPPKKLKKKYKMGHFVGAKFAYFLGNFAEGFQFPDVVGLILVFKRGML
jgi:hypothetical protein